MRFRMIVLVIFALLLLVTEKAEVEPSAGIVLIPGGLSTLGWAFMDTSGWRSSTHGRHQGDDIFALDWNKGTGNQDEREMIFSVASGTVIFASTASAKLLLGSAQTNYGNHVVIQLDDNPNFAVRYAHLNDVFVSSGHIDLGDPVGTLGKSGLSGEGRFTAHLHLALYQNINQYPDPSEGCFDGRETRTAVEWLSMGRTPCQLDSGQTKFAAQYELDSSITRAPCQPLTTAVRVYNVDDLATAYLNGTKIAEVSFLEDTGLVDISHLLQPSTNTVRFTLENKGGAYTYGFQLYESGWPIIDDPTCGVVGVSGCNNNDQQTGIVYDTQVEILTPGTELAAFQDAYNRVRGENTLGCPTGPVQTSGFTSFRGTVGHFQDFENGAVEYHTNNEYEGRAFAIINPLYKKWVSIGLNEENPLGYPTGDLSPTSTSCYGTNFGIQYFEDSALVYHLTGLVYEVHGAIFTKWRQKGHTGCPLGLPIDDERNATQSPQGTTGKVSDFEGGHIHWATDAFEAFETHRDIDRVYVSMGGTASCLGFPTSDEYSFESGARNDFEGGNITWTPEVGAVATCNGKGLTVTSPNGGESWPAGTTQGIRWTYAGNPGSYVKIELLKGGSVDRVIRSRTRIGRRGEGSYNWTIPSGQIPGTNYVVRVTSTAVSTYMDVSNADFTISPPPPSSFTLTATPECSGTSSRIRLNWTSSSGAQTYDVYRNGSLRASVGSARIYTDNSVTSGISYSYFIRASNAYGFTDTDPINITPQSCGQELTITTDSTLPVAYSGIPYSVPLLATGGTGQGYQWRIQTGELPLGLTLNLNTGVVSGTPPFASSEPFMFFVQVKDSADNAAAKYFYLTVNQGPTIKSTSLPDGIVGINYSFQLTAEGGTPPYTWSASGLPEGLSLSENGLLSGVPTQRGDYTVVVSLTDSMDLTVQSGLPLILAYSQDLRVWTQSLPTGTEVVFYRESVEAVGGTQIDYQWEKVSGTLPPGLSFFTFPCGPPGNCTGILEGTPDQAGSYTFSVRVTDSDGNTAEKTFTVVINPVPTDLEIVTSSLPTATIGESYSATLEASGGSGTGYVWSVIGGTLDPGFTLSPDGEISGVPEAPNDCGDAFATTFTVQVTDTIGNVATRPFCLSLFYPSPHIDSVSPSYLVVDGQDHNITVSGSNFIPEAKIYLNGSDTSFINSSTLTTMIYASTEDAANAFCFDPTLDSCFSGGFTLDLYVLGPGGLYQAPSNHVFFPIYNPPPVITSVTALECEMGFPNCIGGSPCKANSPYACYLVIEGTGLVKGTDVTTDATNNPISALTFGPGPPMPFTQINTNTFSPPTAGTFTVTVTNSHQVGGGSTSDSASFTVNPNP